MPVHESCDIELRLVKESSLNINNHKWQFVATTLGPTRRSQIAQSTVWKSSNPRLEPQNELKSNRERSRALVEERHQELINLLVEQGWRLTEATGEYWYSYRFQR